MPYYKVVDVRDGKRTSWAVRERGAVMQYIIGKFVSAHPWLAERGYHLFIMDSLAHAKAIAWNDDEIWEVVAKGVTKVLPAYAEEVTAYGLFHYTFALSNWPRGTLMAKQVKLVKRVYPEE